MANNNITTQDVYAVVFQPSSDAKARLIDVIVAKNRKDACVAFENNPSHVSKIEAVYMLPMKLTVNFNLKIICSQLDCKIF